MRTEDELRQEIEHIESLIDFQGLELVKDARIEVEELDESNPRMQDILRQMSNKQGLIYEDDKEKRSAYLIGLMDGRRQALQWVLGETDDLYENY